MTRIAALFLIACFLAPLASHAVWWQLQDHPRSWANANWSSAKILPPPDAVQGAVVHVMAGRTGRWKGILAHHSWLVIKPAGANRYTRYDVVGWGRALRTDAYPADAHWYGNEPTIVLTLTGEAAQRAIPPIRRAVETYPHGGTGAYVVWPGPNSNTFVASIARQVPELAPALLPTAIGKDFNGWTAYAGPTPSRTGLQLSVVGLLGLTVAWVEGIEFNFLGLVAGIDIRRPALKLPGWGRLGTSAST